jgi:hypothetical protein
MGIYHLYIKYETQYVRYLESVTKYYNYYFRVIANLNIQIDAVNGK